MVVNARGFEFETFTGGPDTGTPVLLLHGFPQHSGQWDKVTPALHAAGLRTIAIDQRGYSASARPTEPADYALTETVQDALSIMDTLGVASCHVVGHDWGAAVAWGMAADHPDHVLSLTAISVPHLSAMTAAIADDESDQRQRSSYMAFFAQLDEAVPAMLADDAKLLKSAFQGGGMSDDQIERYIGPLREPAALRAALSWYTALAAQPRKTYDPVTVPTTYIWGADDIALGRTAAEACGRFVSGDYRFVPLENISHWVPDQAPEVVAAEIIERARRAA